MGTHWCIKMEWEKGRQASGYEKLTFFSVNFPIPWDCHLIRFPTESYIPAHVDGVVEGRHFRLNIILKKPQEGGEFICEDTIINWSRIKLFRPDIAEHSVSRITDGNRLVLSLGCILK